MVSSWVDQGIMNKVQSNKLVFIETQDFIETSMALQNYHKASVAMDNIMVVIHNHHHRHAVMAEEQCCYQWPEAKYLKESISVCGEVYCVKCTYINMTVTIATQWKQSTSNIHLTIH